MNEYPIIIEGDGSTSFSAYAPDLPGVVATGSTVEECEAEMREAIAFHIDGLSRADVEAMADVDEKLARGEQPGGMSADELDADLAIGD